MCVCLSAVCLKAAGAQMDFPASFFYKQQEEDYCQWKVCQFTDPGVSGFLCK